MKPARANLIQCRGIQYGAIAQRLNDEGFRSAKGLDYDDKVVGYTAWHLAVSGKHARQVGQERQGLKLNLCIMKKVT